MPDIEIIWSPTALEHLQAIYDYILADNPKGPTFIVYMYAKESMEMLGQTAKLR